MASTDTDPQRPDGDGGSNPSHDPSPFTDWREQLRDRVKEIRARKLADKRRSGEDSLAERLGRDHDEHEHERTREERLEEARTRAAEASSEAEVEADTQIEATSVDPTADEYTADPEPETSDEAGLAQAARQAIDALEADDGDRRAASSAEETSWKTPPADEPTMFEENPDEVAADERARAETGPTSDAGDPPDSADVPEFAPYDLADDDPVGEMAIAPVTDEADDADEDDHPDAHGVAGPDSDERDSSVPSWLAPGGLDSEHGDEDSTAAPVDLDAIPDDLRDRDIPAWAVPRRKKDRRPADEVEPVFAVEREDAVEPAETARKEATGASWRLEDVEETTSSAEETAALEETRSTDEQPAGVQEDEIDDLAQAALEAMDGAESEAPASEPRPPAPEPSEPGRLPLEEGPIGQGQEATQEPVSLMSSAEVDEDEEERGGEADPLDDVYLVGEFSTRGAGRDSRTAKTPDETADAADEEEDGNDIDPLEALRAAVSGSDRSAGRARRPIPNLYEEDDDEGVEAAPTPFRGLLDEHEEEAGQVENDQRRADADVPAPGPVWDDLDEDPLPDAGPPPDHLDPSAPVSDRVFSALADGLVVSLMGLTLGIAGATAAGTSLVSFVGAAPLPFIGACLLFAFAYGIFFVGTCGQTVGKMIMRVRVIGASRFEVGYATAARRAFFYLLAMVPAGLGLLPAISDPEHRALHDRYSGTRVVKA